MHYLPLQPLVRRALAGAGTRPCALRARRLCGTPQSSSARCCSRNTAAAAGPPPSRRTGCSTCAGPTRLSVRALVISARCRDVPSTGMPHGRAPHAPAAHGAQRVRLQTQVLQADLRQGLCCNVRRDGGLEARNAIRSGSVVRCGPQLVKRRSARRLNVIKGLCRQAKRCLEACLEACSMRAGRRQVQAEQLQGIHRGRSTSKSRPLPRPPLHLISACANQHNWQQSNAVRAHLCHMRPHGVQHELHKAERKSCLLPRLGRSVRAWTALRQAHGCAQRAGARERQGQRARRAAQLCNAAQCAQDCPLRTDVPVLKWAALTGAGLSAACGGHARRPTCDVPRWS